MLDTTSIHAGLRAMISDECVIHLGLRAGCTAVYIMCPPIRTTHIEVNSGLRASRSTSRRVIFLQV